MEQPYSVLADWLSKFHTWPELIQGMWLVAVPVTVLGVTWIVMRGLRDIAAALRGHRYWRGYVIQGVYQDGRGRWMICWHNCQTQKVEWTNPPDLIGREQVARDTFPSPEE